MNERGESTAQTASENKRKPVLKKMPHEQIMRGYLAITKPGMAEAMQLSWFCYVNQNWKGFIDWMNEDEEVQVTQEEADVLQGAIQVAMSHLMRKVFPE